MPLVIPERIDNEDVEKFIKLVGDTSPTNQIMVSVDNIDREKFISTLLPVGAKTYIDDGDLVSSLRAAAAAIP